VLCIEVIKIIKRNKNSLVQKRNKMQCKQSDEQWHTAHSVNAQLNRCILSLDLNVTTVREHQSITTIHSAADESMHKFLQVLIGNKSSNSCNIFQMIVCRFSYCFDMTTETKVWLQNYTKIPDLIFSCLTPSVKVCIHLENFIFVSKCNDFMFCLCLTERKFWHIQLLTSSMYLHREQ